MAHTIVNTIDEILKYDINQIMRPTYGVTSLQDFEQEYKVMLKKLEFLKQYSTFVDNNTNDQANNAASNFKSIVSSLANANETDFVSNKLSNVKNLRNYFESLKQLSPAYGYAALEESGILNDMNFQLEYFKASENFKKMTNEALNQIKEESAEIINKAQEKANEIEKAVRKTAQKISVQEAQNQFVEAATYNLKQSRLWGFLIAGLLLSFILFAWHLLSISFPEKWTWQILYYTTIRISILALISTLLAFAIRIVKSHMHMQQHNLHRKRIANSMAAFVESANSQDQRDLILSQLVSSIASFGITGIFDSNSDGSTKISLDSVTKTVENIKGDK